MKITFVDAVRSGFVNFRKFKGVASRREYWFFVLFTVLLGIVLSTIESIIWPPVETTDVLEALNQPTPLSSAAGIILLLPSLSLTSRRIRDAGWSGKWLLLYLAPIVTLIAATFGVISYLQATPNPTEEELAVSVAYLVPTLLLAFGIQVFLLILCLRPSKSAEQGNRYAEK